MNEINRLRNEVDELDRQILRLISERGLKAQAIGKIKKANGISIHSPGREQSIYDRLVKLNKGPFSNDSILSVFREIISTTRALEAPIKVSYLGPEATFTHIAAARHFGTQAMMIPGGGIQSVFSDVEKKHADFGVVPIENSTEGVVSHTLDLFVDSPLKICSEVVLRIAHHLLSREGDVKKIKTVYSHPHALAQCRNWLAAHLPQVKLKEVESTSQAARKAASEKGTAAIASELAASHYGLPILEKEIQDHVQNYTRFLVIGYEGPDKTGRDKTSILLIAKDEPGILFHILEPLAKAKINLTKIESRPVKKRAWEYMFFADLDGHADDQPVAAVLDQVKNQCAFFKILGSYPKARIMAE